MMFNTGQTPFPHDLYYVTDMGPSERVMEPNLRYPEWQKFCVDALAELDLKNEDGTRGCRRGGNGTTHARAGGVTRRT